MRHFLPGLSSIIRTRLVLGCAALLLAGLALAAAEPPSKQAKARPANRLAQESSPYLLQHAHNPVAWFPWGPEAFAKAKKEGKLVFLSIGYSSCHWCHVMERESFADEAVAKPMNDWFVCIKVDREERPDVDAIYMTALHALGQRGGWPLSMFLTADGKPILGGTYWPPEDRTIEAEKVHGFKSVLKIVHDWHDSNSKELEEQADKVAAATRLALAGMVRGSALVTLNRELVASAVESLESTFDKEHGGFGQPERRFRGTKFPTPPYLSLLAHEAENGKTDAARQVLAFTLDRMACGGIYDHLGGGFHRYSTERTWTVPHFEKMLYDSAQLVELYARAYRLAKDPSYRRVIAETLAFIETEMTSPVGGFYSALDADSEGEEGRFHVWTAQELGAALQGQADAALFRSIYGLDGPANFESKHYILRLAKPLGDSAKELKLDEEQLNSRLMPLRRKLFAIRAQRPRPFLDTKILTAWNGQMIAGYALAGQVLAEPKYLAAAARSADFLLKNLRTAEGRLLHTYGGPAGQTGAARLNAYLDDYAFVVHGLLRLHDASGQRKWLDEAKALTDTMVSLHADAEAGGFYYTSHDHEKLFARAKDQYDGAQPSGNSIAAQNLVRLWLKTKEPKYRALADKTLKTFAGPLKANPSAMTAMAEALALCLDGQDEKTTQDLSKLEPLGQQGGPKRSDAVVKVSANADKPDATGKQALTVTLAIDKGWHIYANPPGLEDLAPVQTIVTVDAKSKPHSVNVEYPRGVEVNDKLLGKYYKYEEKVTIKAVVRRASGDTAPLEVTVKFQSCSERVCLLPATVKVTVP